MAGIAVIDKVGYLPHEDIDRIVEELGRLGLEEKCEVPLNLEGLAVQVHYSGKNHHFHGITGPDVEVYVDYPDREEQSYMRFVMTINKIQGGRIRSRRGPVAASEMVDGGGFYVGKACDDDPVVEQQRKGYVEPTYHATVEVSDKQYPLE